MSGLWYDSLMKMRASQPGRRRSATSGVILGRQRFAKISELSPAAEQRAAEFDRLGLSPEERVRRIVAAHRKG
jgi:non-ribosomal peptide synthetase component E (peptide arylation enzyme)